MRTPTPGGSAGPRTSRRRLPARTAPTKHQRPRTTTTPRPSPTGANSGRRRASCCWSGAATTTGAASARPTRATSTAFSCRDRKSVVEGKSVSVRVDLGGRRIIKKKTYDEIISRRTNDNYDNHLHKNEI